MPWPDKLLSPNARAHWAVKARAVKSARSLGWGLLLEALNGREPKFADGPVGLNWRFHPKTRNTPDDDNALASCKAYRDGMADALGVDDSRFVSTYQMGSPVKGGAVIVTIRGIE